MMLCVLVISVTSVSEKLGAPQLVIHGSPRPLKHAKENWFVSKRTFVKVVVKQLDAHP